MSPATMGERLRGPELVTRRARGAVARVVGHELGIHGLRLAVGDTVAVETRDGARPAEVVAVDGDGARALLFGPVDGLARGDAVRPLPQGLSVRVSSALLGRTIDALGRPLDGAGPLRGQAVGVDAAVPPALERRRISAPLPVGVRVIDGLCTTGRGQRMGIFAGSGVGKSTLLAMMVRGTSADVNVIALIGERGREVREFLEDDLGPDGLARSVVVVATSDEPPLLRLRAAHLATRIAEWFADAGADVLLTMDSVTRLATAQRDVGLAAGEPPTVRGYTPSVFTLLPRLLERAGPRRAGTVTGFYTVLVDGGDMDEPVADAVRSILDGHVVLDRALAHAGRYPPVDPLASLSRLADKVTEAPHQRDAADVRAALAAAADVRDLVEVGAYVAGTNPAADAGLALQDDIRAFVVQDAHETSAFDDTTRRLADLAARYRSALAPTPAAADGKAPR